MHIASSVNIPIFAFSNIKPLLITRPYNKGIKEYFLLYAKINDNEFKNFIYINDVKIKLNFYFQ